jgi:C_GCAxxG_C_C family probable redox protein
MVIGLKYGKTETGDDAATEKTRALTRRFITEFTRKNGSVNCTDLLGCDLSNPDDYARARDTELFITKCPLLVRDAADIVEEILKNGG